VWLVDLGLAAKVRPGLVLSVSADEDSDRVLTTIVPHTTAVRGSRFEVPCDLPFLKPGAFDAQNLVTVATVKLSRRLGVVSSEVLASVEVVVKTWLGLP
jgi:mRNA interferase MazF